MQGLLVQFFHVSHLKEMPLVRKPTGNHLMNSTSLEKLRALSLVSATLQIEYATQQCIGN